MAEVLNSLDGREHFTHKEKGEFRKKEFSDRTNLSSQKYCQECACIDMTAPREATRIPTTDKTEIVERKPRHQRYETHQSRLESFVGWPGSYVPKTPDELASAGFYYIGSADRVTCYQCGITLRDWEAEHDPVTEHQRYAPDCDFIKHINVGQISVKESTEELIIKSKLTESIESTDIQEPKSTYSSSDRVIVTSDSACDLPPEGFNSDLHLGGGACACPLHVKSQPVTCLTPLIKTDELNQEDKTSQISINDSDIKCSVEESVTISTCKARKSKKLTTLQEENRRLKEKTTCRVCKHSAASILFLPCGHLITCPDCAEKVRDCVMCKKTILGTVKTFRA